MFRRNNTWWTCVRNSKGRKVQKSLDTSNKKEAQRREAKIRTEIGEGKFFDKEPESVKTFKEMSEKYMDEIAPEKATSTFERYNDIFRVHLVPFFGDKLLAEIRARDISEFRFKRKKKGAKPATVQKELNTMKAAFNVAIKEWEWLESNPVSKIRPEKQTPMRVRYLNDEERGKLGESAEEWLKPMIAVARYTGMRQGNLLTLKWRDIDLERSVLVLPTTKSGEPLGLPICAPLLKLLTRLRKVRNLNSNFVFSVEDGSPIYKVKLERAFKRACKKAGIVDFRWHDLRHDFASCLVQNGVDLYKVQKLLGHSDLRMTQRYAHLAPDNLRDALDVFGKS